MFVTTKCLRPSIWSTLRPCLPVINSFFGTNQLSQFMDQTNPWPKLRINVVCQLWDLEGLSRERAGFGCVTYTIPIMGVCAPSKPQKDQIWFDFFPSVFAKWTTLLKHFIETPCRKVENGKIDIKTLPSILSAEEEENAKLLAISHWRMMEPSILIVLLHEWKGISSGGSGPRNYRRSTQSDFSISASLIPFLEHDDANRALMGSTWCASGTIVAGRCSNCGNRTGTTGCFDSRALINAEGDGVVEYCGCRQNYYQIRPRWWRSHGKFWWRFKTYELIKFRKTNQNTCINLKPICEKGWPSGERTGIVPRLCYG